MYLGSGASKQGEESRGHQSLDCLYGSFGFDVARLPPARAVTSEAMRWPEVPGPIVGVVEIKLLSGKNSVSASSTAHEARCDDRGEHLSLALVIGAIAAGGCRALALHVPALAALRFSRRRSTFCRSRSAYASGFVRLNRRSRQEGFPQMTRCLPVSSSPHSVQCVCSVGRVRPRFAAAFARTCSRFRQ